MKTILLAFLVIFPLSSNALLPPLYETAAVIQAILADPQLREKLPSGDVIITLQKNDKGYEITTNHHRLQVDVANEPQTRPGPARYQLTFNEPISL